MKEILFAPLSLIYPAKMSRGRTGIEIFLKPDIQLLKGAALTPMSSRRRGDEM